VAHTAYTYQLRSVECEQCGGPVVTQQSATEAQCGFCNAVLRLVVRPKDAVHEPIDESARMAGLAAQVGKQDANGPLAARPPDGMHAFAAMLTDRSARPAAVAALRQEWGQARAEATAQPSRQSGTRAFRAALLLARFYAADDDDKRARAVAETAINIVSEPGQRDILRLWLARAALDAGDSEAYDAWLADVNPQPVHLEVDSALRLTRARRALSDNLWDGVASLVGSYPREVPLAAESEKAARLVRAHAFAGRGDEVSARRELRGALADASDPHELVRILLDEYPGPAAHIAEEEAAMPRQAAIAAAVTAPAAAQAYATSKKRAKVSGVAALAIGCTSFAPMLIFFVPMIAPSVFLSSCGMDSVEAEVIRAIEGCPAAVAALGQDVAPAPGMSCGNMETGGGSGYANWSFAVSGNRGRGSVSFYAVETGGTWRLQQASLEADGQDMDLLVCSRGASVGLNTQIGGIPGMPAGVEVPGLPSDTPEGAAMLNLGASVLQAQCDSGDMNGCHALSMMYRTVPDMLDEEKARELSVRACEGGHQGACQFVDR